MRFVGEGLYPTRYVRVTQTGSSDFPISITISSILSAEQAARLRATIATIHRVSIQ
jgi:hypothetical protein